MEKLKKRNEIEEKYKWAIEDLFATDELCEKAIADCEKLAEEISSFEGKLGESADTLLAYLKLNDKVYLLLEKIGNYAMRKSDEDTTNSKYLALKGKFMNLYVTINSAESFFTPELISLDKSLIEKFYCDKPELKLYKRLIDVILEKQPHTLSKELETLIAETTEMADAPDTIGSVFRNADLKFPDAIDKDGNPHKVTQGSYISLVSSSDRVLRKNAFDSVYSTYGSFRNTTAAFLDAQEKQLKFYTKARKYPSSLEASLSNNEVPVSVYKNLIESVHNNMHYMDKYMALRKKLLGVDELHMYDLYTPVIADCDSNIPYEKAKEMVYDALKPMGEDYLKILQEGFDNRWIDVYENEGKCGGAYSSCGDPHPLVLLNYDNTLDSVFTLAHEMGHAIHTYHSIKNQPTVYSDYVIFVAEVASTCNEALLMADLLKKTEDKKQKAYLINHFLEQFRTTLYRQTMFAEFELKMSEMVESGETLTADELCKIYHELNKLYYGDNVVIDSGIDVEWARIPHFFMNFYVFQYATGFSAAMALSSRILKEGKSAVDDYIKFLSGGSSKDPISLLKIAGVDMTTTAPIDAALAQFGALVDELEEILK